MKKIFAIALALVMVLGIATSALAVSWASTTTATSSSPFTAEVIKLGANSGVTGAEYYTVLSDAAAYDYSNIFYAIKLSIPSASQANTAYAGANYKVGQEIKVTITYTNVSGKTSDTKYVKIGSSAKTLWYNGKTNTFEESWIPSVTNACGCGDQHVIKATATGNKEVKIKVCFAAKGKLSDIKIAGCYNVEQKKFCGIKPCPNCSVTDVNGYRFWGDCAKFDVFFSTNSAGKVLGAYVIDKCSTYTQDTYGSMKLVDKTLYGWQYADKTCPDCNDCPGSPVLFELQELPYETIINDYWTTWENGVTYGGLSREAVARVFAGSCGVLGSTVKNTSAASIKATMINDAGEPEFGHYDYVYIKNDDGSFTPVATAGAKKIMEDLVGTPADNLYLNAKTTADIVDDLDAIPLTITAKTGVKTTETNVKALDGLAMTEEFDSGRFMMDGTKQKDWSKYYGTSYVYGRTYYFCYDGTDDVLFAQLTADKFNCDTNDGSYLNAINYLYSVLGFTFADIQAGNVYMTDDILLANFGFMIAPCGEAVWGAYTAAITVASVAEVPATGAATFAGFAMIVLAAGAAVASKKRA